MNPKQRATNRDSITTYTTTTPIQHSHSPPSPFKPPRPTPSSTFLSSKLLTQILSLLSSQFSLSILHLILNILFSLLSLSHISPYLILSPSIPFPTPQPHPYPPSSLFSSLSQIPLSYNLFLLSLPPPFLPLLKLLYSSLTLPHFFPLQTAFSFSSCSCLR